MPTFTQENASHEFYRNKTARHYADITALNGQSDTFISTILTVLTFD